MTTTEKLGSFCLTLPHFKVCATFDPLRTLTIEIVLEARTFDHNLTGRTLFVTLFRALMTTFTLPLTSLKALDNIVAFVKLLIVALPLARVTTL